jgi:hypothetical protein
MELRFFRIVEKRTLNRYVHGHYLQIGTHGEMLTVNTQDADSRGLSLPSGQQQIRVFGGGCVDCVLVQRQAQLLHMDNQSGAVKWRA